MCLWAQHALEAGLSLRAAALSVTKQRSAVSISCGLGLGQCEEPALHEPGKQSLDLASIFCASASLGLPQGEAGAETVSWEDPDPLFGTVTAGAHLHHSPAAL